MYRSLNYSFSYFDVDWLGKDAECLRPQLKKEFAKKEKEIQQQLQSQKRRESEPEPNPGMPLTSLNYNNENGSRDDDYKYQKSISQHDTLVKKHEILSTRQDNQQAPIRLPDAKLSDEPIDRINVAKQSSGSPGVMKKIQLKPANAVSSSPKETKRGGNSKKKNGASSAFISSLLADDNITLQQKEGDSSPAVFGTWTNKRVALPARGASPAVANGTVLFQNLSRSDFGIGSTGHTRETPGPPRGSPGMLKH